MKHTALKSELSGTQTCFNFNFMTIHFLQQCVLRIKKYKHNDVFKPICIKTYFTAAKNNKKVKYKLDFIVHSV